MLTFSAYKVVLGIYNVTALLLAFYELPTLVCARYCRRALRECETVCRCSGGQMVWSPDPHRIIIKEIAHRRYEDIKMNIL